VSPFCFFITYTEGYQKNKKSGEENSHENLVSGWYAFIVATGLKKQGSIDCFTCIHFYVTWDKKHPRGCKALGFKSREIPSLVVFQSSGYDCLRYKEKKSGTKTEGS
jgi:hypothetical protein